VTDAKYRSLREPIPPTVYNPVVDGFDEQFILHVRTGQRPEAIVAPVREALRSLDPELPFIEVRTCAMKSKRLCGRSVSWPCFR